MDLIYDDENYVEQPHDTLDGGFQDEPESEGMYLVEGENCHSTSFFGSKSKERTNPT